MEGFRSLPRLINVNVSFIVKAFYVGFCRHFVVDQEIKWREFCYHCDEVSCISSLFHVHVALEINHTNYGFSLLCDWFIVIINTLNMVLGKLAKIFLMSNVKKSKFNWNNHVLWFSYDHSHAWKQYTFKARLVFSWDMIV